jgi:hypothetical protein
MTIFQVRIDTDGDAFEFMPHSEIARILRDIATRIECEESDAESALFPSRTIRDSNGNYVGSYWHKNGGN